MRSGGPAPWGRRWMPISMRWSDRAGSSRRWPRTRHASWQSSFEEARLAAEARLAEATRLAEELAAASRREVSEILSTGWAAPATISEPAPEPVTDRVLAPTPPPVVHAELAAPALIADAAETNEAFWREEAQATAARSVATKAVESIAPIEALLPVLALVLLLVAVLVLIG